MNVPRGPETAGITRLPNSTFVRMFSTTGMCSMPESFGARLRQHRESQGIDLFTIAERTKIKLPLLEALERDDVSGWPSGISAEPSAAHTPRP